MTEDRHDAQIRDLVADLAASAPPPPPFSRIAERLDHQKHSAQAAGTITVLASDADDRRPDDVPPYVKAPVERRPQRSKPWRLMAALVALGLASAGGLFAYGSFSADDGSATPEQAVKQFVGAFGSSDVAGMLETLPPSERVVLRESLESLNREGKRLRITRDLDLNHVSGVHLEVTGLQLSTARLAEGVATVGVRGRLRSTANDQELPIGDAARDALTDWLPDRGYQGVADAVEKSINDNTTNGSGIQLVTVKEAGGWHVSVWYTLAEYLRKSAGAPMPDFGNNSVKATGAGSPESAVKALFETSGDYLKSLALAAPDESRVLYDYVPVMARHAPAYFDATTTVRRLGTHVDGDGDRRVVHVDSYDLAVSYRSSSTEPGSKGDATADQSGTTRTTFDGNCLTTASTSSGPGSSGGEDKQTVCRKEALARGATPLQWDLAMTRQVTVERHDGRWFVSPVRSLVGETVDRLARVPDAKAFTDLLSAKDTPAAAELLPLDLLETVLGSPYTNLYFMLAYPSSTSVSSGAGEITSSAPTTAAPNPPTSVPASTSTSTTAVSSSPTSATGGSSATAVPSSPTSAQAGSPPASSPATTIPGGG